MRFTLLVAGVILVVIGVLAIGKAVASKPKDNDRIEPLKALQFDTSGTGARKRGLNPLTIDSYALRAVRPGPLVPAGMTPTILREEPGTVAEGITPT